MESSECTEGYEWISASADGRNRGYCRKISESEDPEDIDLSDYGEEC